MLDIKAPIRRVLAASGLLVVAVLGARAADTQWLAHCSKNLASRHLPTPAVRTYCSCMAGLGDDDEMLEWNQKELEKSFPYMHGRCVDQAAKHRGDAS